MMSRHVIIIQSDQRSVQPFLAYFQAQGDQVWSATNSIEAQALLAETNPNLVVADLHLSGNGWQDVIRQVAAADILFTTFYPDPDREQHARKICQSCAFVQPPFTPASIAQALYQLEEASPSVKETKRPRVRYPVRIKITLPYIILALILAMAAAYVVNQVVLDTIEERFINQLIEAGKLTSDWMVREEDRLLESLRLVAYTEGVSDAVVNRNSERLRELALPLAVNYQEEAIEILDNQGTSLLSLRHRAGGNIEDYTYSQGETVFTLWDFVGKVINGQVTDNRDKYAGLARAPWGDFLYVAGPIVDPGGKPVGIVLVGKSLPTLTRQIRQDTLAHTTFYESNGRPIESTLLTQTGDNLALSPPLAADVLARQDEEVLMRPISVASINYSEILGPWEVGEYVRSAGATRTNNDQGLVGVALPESFLVNPSRITQYQIFVLTTAAILLVIGLGVIVANRLTRPLLQVVDASAKVAAGDLEVHVDSQGQDEVAILAYSFNQMVAGLKEGFLYRDLLGRTVSPEVREELRHGFASGNVRLEGQEAVATVLTCNIRGFTTLAEKEKPATVLNWLNEYFDTLVPIVIAHDGVISTFEGDAMLVFFGILPRPLSPQESAYQGCKTALAMLEAVELLNHTRLEQGDPSLSVGVGINTGPVTAGALGSSDRLHYTIIGDTVNTTFRMETLTQQLGQQSSAIISQHTLFSLRDKRHEFKLEPLGAHTLRGKVEQLLVYHLCTRHNDGKGSG
jgi:adenylate cyclase